MTPAPQTNLDKALRDVVQGLAAVHVWPMLAWQEIRQRYRRSVLGPFWLTISTAALLGGMGPLYGTLFGQPLSGYFPHLVIGFVVWLLISGLINEGCQAFIAAEGLIKQTKMPLSVHVLRVVWRNLIVFAHYIVIIVVTLAIFPPHFGWGLLTVLVGVLLIAVNGYWVGLLGGMVCARFRDVPLIVQSVVQIAFFLTPVMWKAGSLGRYQRAVTLNPFYHFLEVIRAPLSGEPIPVNSWLAAFCITAVGCAVAFAFFVRFRARIAYWV
jgi:homopolymeric O-antigen transport system permease protein